MSTLGSRVIKTENVDWRSFQFIQQEGFKDLPDDAKAKLRESIIQNSFTQPFYVWEDPDGILFCLDGRHRVMILEEIEEEYQVPDLLPATFIQCENKKEAARLVAIYSSLYAKVTQQGLFDFLAMYELSFEEMQTQMDLPDFSEDRFIQKFDLYQTADAEEPEVELPEGEPIVNEGDIFQVNEHRIICGSFRDKKVQHALMEGQKARIVICDPPYNLPANFFTNKDSNRHKDFAMGAGEMSDEEFVIFLQEIMEASVANTIPGAIHYIFMDWRHVWHMTEAGRRVYGSAIPKQMCVWNKDIMANGSFYRAKHEICFVFNNSNAKALWNKDLSDHGGNYKDNEELVFIFKAGDDDVKHLSHLELKDRIRTNVWNYPSAVSTSNPDRLELKNHPTPKPVQMIADAILDTTNPGEIVVDWFLGSGTSLIAAEHTGRIFRGSEIDRCYVHSIIRRYLNYCEKRGVSVNFRHLNGELTLNDFKNER